MAELRKHLPIPMAHGLPLQGGHAHLEPRIQLSALQSGQDDSADAERFAPSWYDHALSGLAAELEVFRASHPSATFEVPPVASWAGSISDPVSPAELAPSSAAQPRGGAMGTLSASQAELLRHLTLAEAPVPIDDLDGRVLGALCRRGLVTVEEGHARATDEGTHYFESKVRKRRRIRFPRLTSSDSMERAENILQAVRLLEAVLPRNMSHAVGDLRVETPDLLGALQGYAGQLRTSLPQPES